MACFVRGEEFDVDGNLLQETVPTRDLVWSCRVRGAKSLELVIEGGTGSQSAPEVHWPTTSLAFPLTSDGSPSPFAYDAFSRESSFDGNIDPRQFSFGVKEDLEVPCCAVTVNVEYDVGQFAIAAIRTSERATEFTFALRDRAKDTAKNAGLVLMRWSRYIRLTEASDGVFEGLWPEDMISGRCYMTPTL